MFNVLLSLQKFGHILLKDRSKAREQRGFMVIERMLIKSAPGGKNNNETPA